MKRGSQKSSSVEEDASTSQQDMTQQSKAQRESHISSSNAKNSSQKEPSKAQNDYQIDDEPTHSMARQEAQKEIETAKDIDADMDRNDLYDQLAAQQEVRQRTGDSQGTRDIMSAPQQVTQYAPAPQPNFRTTNDNRDQLQAAIFTQNQTEHEKTYPAQNLANRVQKNREVMTAPFGQTRGARMYAAGFGQSQNKANIISESHQFNQPNASLDTHRNSEGLPEPSIRRTQQRAQALQQCFVESDLLKATNIYQQFDRKGNLFENRLYAKTSINQARLNKEQNNYEKMMASHADENCRINNGSMQGSDNGGATGSNTGYGRSQMGTGNEKFNQTGMSSINRTSQQSQSFTNIAKTSVGNAGMTAKYSRKPKTGQGERNGRNKTMYGNMRAMSSSQNTENRCTFSRANGPRIATADMISNPNRPYGEMASMNQTMIERLMVETNEINKDRLMDKASKTQQNVSFLAAQKSIGKLQNLQGVVNGWSMRDQDLSQVTHGVGGLKKTFKTAQNFMTNDPQYFKLRSISHSKRLEHLPPEQQQNLDGYSNLPYFYCMTPENGSVPNLEQTNQITNKDSIFQTSKSLNMQAKQFYSKMLDGKGASNVFNIGPQPDNAAMAAGDLRASRIQKKAYRANTTSNQVDGLFKPQKFNSRINMLNNSRVDYNILRPTETHDTTKFTMNVRPDYVMDNMRSGKCHQVYGISEFYQNNRLAGIKLHEKYQAQISKDSQAFRRVNGEFSMYADEKKRQTLH